MFQELLLLCGSEGELARFYNTDFMNYPFGQDLGIAVRNSLHLFFYLPLRPFFDYSGSYNMLLIIISILNFITFYFLAKYIFGSKSPALVAALVFSFNSYLLLKMNLGFLQKYLVFWIPLYCLSLFKLQRTRKTRYLISAIFYLLMAFLTYTPYGIYTVILTALLASYSFFRRDELIFAWSGVFVILAAVSILFFLVHFSLGSELEDFTESEHIIVDLKHPDFHESLQSNHGPFAAGNFNLFSPFRFFPYAMSRDAINTPLGISVIAALMALVGVFSGKGLPRLLLAVFLVFVLLSAGLYLRDINYRPFRIFEYILNSYKDSTYSYLVFPFRLPYFFLVKFFPFTSGIKYPIRLFPFINLSLALMAVYGIRSIASTLNKKHALSILSVIFAVFFVAETLFLFGCYFPPGLHKVVVPAFYTEIRDKTDFEAILNLPHSDNRDIINHYGFYTFRAKKKMVNPYSKKQLSTPMPVPGAKSPGFHKQLFINNLGSCQTGYIVLHDKYLRDSDDPCCFDWLKDYCEYEVYQEDQITAFRIP